MRAPTSLLLCTLLWLNVSCSGAAPVNDSPGNEPPGNGQGDAVSSIFWSGHSLTDPPIPQMVAAISASLGTEVRWNRHSMAGASMEARTRGRPPNPNGWDGYRQGANRGTSGLDVIAELRSGATVGGGGYDALVITEVHDFLYSVVRMDTVRLLRHYHERFLEGNPQGQTFLYQAWLNLSDRNDPQLWMDYERAAEPVWRCLATRVNLSLEHEGRADRLSFIPAGLALVEFADELVNGNNIPGIATDTNAATLEKVFRDTVHLTDLGSYFISLVNYAFINQRSPAGAWAPDDINADTAQAMQEFAWAFYTRYQANNVPLTMDECSARIRDSFAQQYWEFLHDRAVRNDKNTLFETMKEQLIGPARVRRNTQAWQQAFADDSPQNPFLFDPDTDATIWHPAP